MIRRMTVEDISRVSEIEANIFTSAWSEADFIYEITENPFGCYFVWEEVGQIAGYLGLWILYEQAQITTLGIAKEFRRRGIAHALLAQGIAHAFEKGVTTISLEVRISNSAAITLYTKVGFCIAGRREDYYQDNHEDAHLMILERN